MVDATIKMVLERLVPIIEKKVRDEVNLVLNSPEEAASLASKLKKIRDVLQDAERKSITDHKVEAWLEKIKEAAYEMEDALDEWEVKLVEMKSDGSHYGVFDNFMEKVSSFIQSLCLCFKHAPEIRGIALTIKQLNIRLESIDKEIHDEFKFVPDLSKVKPLPRSQASRAIKMTIPVSYFDVDNVNEIVGRDDEKDNIVSKLLSMRSRHDDGLQIISIVGIGGLGTTTLARLVFNNSSVQEYFDKTIWVRVSRPFNLISIANSILNSLTGNSQEEKGLQILLERIETSAKDKIIFLVLDNVPEYDKEKWNTLKNCVSKAAPGSRVLVTTSDTRVAQSMSTSQILPLRQLSDKECWSVLSRVAFKRGDRHDPRKQEICLEIAKRCNGLPLAAKTLGSLLHTKNSVEEWENVLRSQTWELEGVTEDLFRHLYLSYNELGSAVKHCFSYCATFPKDREIDVDDLIKMWMAQGFLSGERGDEMESKGREYVQDLAVRHFFQDLKRNSFGIVVSCKMHDIVHDFAQSLRKHECLVVESINDTRKLVSSLKNARHLTWLVKEKSLSPVSMCTVEKLRSFRCKGNLSPDVLRALHRVRELSLHSCELEELQPKIGKLIHLRYLDLSGNPLRRLGNSLCYLYHLQTLILEGCSNLSMLPEEIHKLRNLRHILVEETVSFPQGLEELIYVRTLVSFRASHGGSKLGYLENLRQLEILHIVIDDFNEDSDAIDEASKAELKNKNRLRYLVLAMKKHVRTDIVEALEPPPYLPNLMLSGYVGFEFPHWITMSLHNLKILRVEHCSSLPQLGTLQSLEELYIWFMDEMEWLGHEFLGITDGRGAVAFPYLEKLEFRSCSQWKKWEDIGDEEENIFDSMEIMPRLSELSVTCCPNLKSLPHRLLRRTPLEHLDITESYDIIQQYESKGYEFWSPTCKVLIDFQN